MDSSSIDERFKFASGLIQEAGDLALDYFGRLETLRVLSKGPQDMATEADLNTELLIRDALKLRFPEDAFLGEETGRTKFASSQGIWVVDPIDGTQPFNGSGALTLCYVACGRLIGYVEPHINSWDCLGALAINSGRRRHDQRFLVQ
jgi:myo-inositol-1(or 4)-monophosphatase